VADASNDGYFCHRLLARRVAGRRAVPTAALSLAPGPTSRQRVRRSIAIALGSALVGAAIFTFGLLSALHPEPVVYSDFLAGYDPPFDCVAGVLLMALSFRLREQSLVAWLFSLLAPILTIFIAVFSPNLYSIISAGAATCLVALIFPFRMGFYRGAVTGPEATQTLVLVAALLSILFGMVGSRWLSGQFQPPIRGWGDSLYFTIATISTNGTNFTPEQDPARVFVVILILLGVGTFLSAVVVIFLPVLERRLEAVTARLERAQMEELSEHVIICGATAEAQATAEVLRDRTVRSVILADDPKAIELLRSDGFRVRLGEPSSEEDLRAVGIDRARALVVAQDSDAESLLTVITARAMVPNLRIVAVATAAASAAKLRKAGANETISLVSVAAGLVSTAALDQPGPARPTPS
jgi:voltage-gated potassium channel Kch